MGRKPAAACTLLFTTELLSFHLGICVLACMALRCVTASPALPICMSRGESNFYFLSFRFFFSCAQWSHCLCSHGAIGAGAVLGTGEPGSRPGRHFFMTRGGRHERLKKIKKNNNNNLGREAVFYYLSHITAWGIGKLAPPAAAGAPAR